LALDWRRYATLEADVDSDFENAEKLLGTTPP
jgi:hypothetical protein